MSSSATRRRPHCRVPPLGGFNLTALAIELRGCSATGGP